MKRGYQEKFYNLCERVRDPVSRAWQARKIAYALVHYAGLDLSSCICLDIGCSSGMITSAIAPLFYKTIGLEYDKDALRATDPTNRTRVQFIQGDAMSLPISDRAINVVICAQVYEHVPDAERLFSEIYRVLSPGGVVFFSGPNWLFPIEPHYSLPFLHWLPAGLSNVYLRLTRRGDYYYERLHHLWGLRRLMRHFDVQDITVDMLRAFYLPKMGNKIIQKIPDVVWKFLLPLFPGFNYILRKPGA